MSVIDASSRFGRRVKSTTVNRVTEVRIVQSCPICNSMNFHVAEILSKEMPTLFCSECNYEAGTFEFIELPG